MTRDSRKQLAELSTAKQALLARRLAQRASREIRPIDRTAPMPASFAQESFWFAQQLDPHAPTFNLASVFQLSGALDAPALSRAIDAVVARHEVLRTTFEAADGRLVVRVHEPRNDVLRVEDAEGSTDAREDAEARTPFDLGAGPLLRATLLRRSPTEHLLLLTMHHSIGDDWSWGIIERELLALYSAFTRGEASPLPPLELQYADYAAWQRDTLTGPRLQKLVEFWKARLAGAAALALPTDHARRAQQHRASDVFEVVIPGHVTAALTELARARGATLNMALTAAFGAFLSLIAGQEDVVIGSPIAVRERAEIEPLVGLFVNNLAIRVSTSGDPTFGELISRTASGQFDAFAHAELPFSMLIAALGGPRDSGRNPVYQTMFTFHAKRQPTIAADGVSFVRSERERKRSTVLDLVLMLLEGPDGVRGVLEYDTTLFAPQTAERLRNTYLELVERLAMYPDRPIRSFAPKRDTWNQTERAYPRDRLIHDLIADQAARTPDAVALSFETARLTYRELDERANRIAGRLRERGVGPETLVAVSMERSLELVVALLGILKCGGAYVPLDPSYPEDRLRYMIEDARAALVLTSDQIASWHAGPSVPFAAPVLGGDHLAYVIYTSGSTGRPKGAMNRHAAILNRLQWMQEAYPIGPGDVVLQKTPYSFDVSVWELFWPLLTGATLVVARPDGHKDPSYLRDVILREQVTTLHFVPSMLSVFLESAAGCDSIRAVIASGEALPLALAQRFHARLPRAALHNLYGPTEAAVDVSAYTCRWDHEPSIPIGRPIANVQLHIVGADLTAAPIGATGELFISGVALGRGYWRRPALTAERFLPDPFGPPGSRMYRTGDLAVRRSDGEIEYLGRSDHQVKIRGFRIELGEIEETLRNHPGVSDAAVLVHEASPDDRRLVAYIVAADAPAVDDLRERLRTRLPEHMIPSAFSVLDAFPITPNGKLDRAALLARPLAPVATGDGTAASSDDEVQQKIAKIWSEVLRVDQVGLDDDFFDLGGHSLLLTQLAARIERELGVAVALRVLFDDPTVRGVSAAVAERLAELEKLIAGVENLSPEEVEALLRGEDP